MREPRDTDPTRPAAPPPAEPPHGLVREIREEIGHAVEHVPRPVRWTVRKLAALAVLSLLALAALLVVTGILYVANRTEWVAKEVTLLLNGTLARRSDVAVEIADIRGNPFREVRLIRPRLRYRDGGGPPLLEAPVIRVSYSAWGLVTGGGRSLDVTIEEPVVRLARSPEGGPRLPAWRGDGPSPPRGRGLAVRLRLRRGTLSGPDPIGDLEGVDLEAAVTTGPATRVDVRRLSWKRGPYATRDVRLSGELTAGDSVRFVLRRLRSPDVSLTARGGWKKGGERRIRAEVERLRWEWLAQATDNRTLDVDGGARLSVEARGDRDWRGAFTTRLDWAGLDVTGGGEFVWADGRLTLERLEADSPAGRLHGRLAWSERDWEVAGNVRGGDPSRWAALGIPGWPEGSLSGEFRYGVAARGGPSARLEATLGASELAGWRMDRAEVRVAFPAQGPDSFAVRMARRGGEVTLAGQAADGRWQGRYAARGLPLDEWPEGRESGIRGILTAAEGAMAGEAGAVEVSGSLAGEATDWLGARVAAWRLDDVRGTLLPKPDLAAVARLDGAAFLGTRFDSAAMRVRLGDGEVALDSVRAAAGDTTVSLAGRAAWGDAGWRLVLDRAEARGARFHWTAEPPVALSGDAMGVVFDRLAARDGEAYLEVAGRWATGAGAHDWTARVSGLDLARTGWPGDGRVAGRGDALVEVRGRADEPRWSLRAACSGPAWGEHRADSLAMDLAGGPATVEVRRAFLALDGGSLAARGTLERTATPWPDTLTAEGVVGWLASAARWRGEVTASTLPLERLERLTPAAKGWSGRLSGTLEVGGRPARPELTARAEARPLAWEGYGVDDLQARVTYRDERLEVPELRMTRRDLVSTAQGGMPLKLELGSRPEVPEREMTWRLELPNGDLAVLPLFVPQVGAASGRFEMSARVRGTPRHPDLEGYLRVRGGRLRLAGREEILDQVVADCRLDESRITLDSLIARQGERGRIRATGVVEVTGSGLAGYRFDLRMRDFTAAEAGIYAAQFDGDFKVANGPEVNGQIVPFVEGTLELRRAVVLFDFANQTEVQRLAATTQPLFWTYRIQVNATSGLRWQPPDGDIEFGASLTMEQSPEQLTIDGQMGALRGTYYFLSNRFTVRRADLTFKSVDGANPELDIEATTTVVPTREPAFELGSAGDGRPETHVVRVGITGKANEPVIEFSSEPPDWDEARILRELTVGRFYAGGVPLGDPLDNYVTRAINKTLSAEMSRAFHGYLSDWVVERERGGLWIGEGDIFIGFGTQITPNLLLRYRQRVPGLGREVSRSSATASPFERDVEAEYRLNRFFYITSELTQRRALTGATSTVSGVPDFNVNLKARWEY